MSSSIPLTCQSCGTTVNADQFGKPCPQCGKTLTGNLREALCPPSPGSPVFDSSVNANPILGTNVSDETRDILEQERGIDIHPSDTLWKHFHRRSDTRTDDSSQES